MASGVLNPIDNPQAWDVIVVGGVESPGICSVTGFKRTNEWDVKKGKGTVGATTTYVQKPPASGQFKFTLWTAAHFVAWEAFRALLKYDPTKQTVQAIDLYYPSLADLDIKSIVINDIGAIENEGQQKYSITVTAQEYFPTPKKSAVSTPTGSADTSKNPKTTPGTTPDPIADAQQAEIRALMAKAAAL